jgi:hypothetical protein
VAAPAIILGRPVTPAHAEPPPNEPPQLGATVDEALSVLAWLQSRRVPEPHASLPPLGAVAQEMVRRAAVGEERLRSRSELDDVTQAALNRQHRVPLAILFSLGIATGVMGTLAAQALFSHSREAKPTPPVVALKVRPSDGEPKTEPRPAAGDAGAESAQGQSARDLQENAERAAQRPLHIVALGPIDVTPEVEQIPSIFTDNGTVTSSLLSKTDTSADASGPQSTIDLMEPKGARIRLDGVLIKDKVPIKALVLKPGHHELRIMMKGRTKRDLAFSIDPGERIDLTKRLKRHPGAK